MKGNDATHLDLPSGIAVLKNGNIIVTDGYGNNRVLLFDKTGKLLKQVGKGYGGPDDKGTGPSEWHLPHKLAVDAQENLYIIDRENKRVQVFDKDLELPPRDQERLESLGHRHLAQGHRRLRLHRGPPVGARPQDAALRRQAGRDLGIPGPWAGPVRLGARRRRGFAGRRLRGGYLRPAAAEVRPRRIVSLGSLVGRSLAACVLALLCAAPAAAQDRLLQIGWLWELAGTELTRLRPMSEVPWNAVLVAGSRYVLAPVRLNGETAALGYLDIEAGTRGLVPGVSLEWPGNASYSGSPALAADPWRPRVFIWHGSRISEVSASSGLREVITNLGPLPYLVQRRWRTPPRRTCWFSYSQPDPVGRIEVIIARATPEKSSGESRSAVACAPGRRPPEEQVIITWSPAIRAVSTSTGVRI